MEFSNSYFLFFMGSQRAKACLKDDFKVIIVLDIGVEINVMIEKAIEDTNLAMRQKLKLDLISYTSQSWSFLRLYKDMEIAIRKLKTRHQTFIVKAKYYNHVLDQPFLNFIKFSKEYKSDDIFDTIIYSHIFKQSFSILWSFKILYIKEKMKSFINF